MDHREVKAMMTEIAGVVREHVTAAVSPIAARLSEIEARVAAVAAAAKPDEEIKTAIASAIASLPSVEDGERMLADIAAEHRRLWDLDLDRLRAESRAAVADFRSEIVELKSDGERMVRDCEALVAATLAHVKDGEPGPAGADGKDAEIDWELLDKIVHDRVDEAVAELPPAEKGEKGDPGPAGADGKDAPSVPPEALHDAVAAYLSENPVPAGKDGDPGERGPEGPAGMNGKDGVGLAGAFRDKRGHLMVTMTNGTVHDLGEIDGKDGAPGRDGIDGLGFDDMEVLYDGERHFTLRFTRGEKVVEKKIRVPAIIDRGVYKADTTYEAGDSVSHGGSLWIAQQATNERPDSGNGWRLSTKKGRDGKDLRPEPETEKPEESKPVRFK